MQGKFFGLILIFMIALLSGCGQVDKNTITSPPSKTTPAKMPSKKIVAPSNASALAPFNFEGRAPTTVKADEPFSFIFTFFNNSDIPIVAAKIEIEAVNDVKRIIPDPKWEMDTIFDDVSLFTRDIHLTKGQSLSSQIKMVIARPGTHQFKIIPSVKADDVRNNGEYFLTVIVLDTQEAQALRQRRAELSNEIETNLDELIKASNNISWIETRLSTAKQQQDLELRRRDYLLKQANQYPSDRKMYTDNANASAQEAQRAGAEVTHLQGQLAAAQQQYNNLKAERASLEQEQKRLQ